MMVNCFKLTKAVILNHRTLPGGEQAAFNFGKTLVHEVGHWLGLGHVSEGDTGPQMYGNTICLLKPKLSCKNVKSPEGIVPNTMKEAFNNFMDFLDDTCVDNFTAGQIRRMRETWFTYRGRRVQDKSGGQPPDS
jgi:hypothetical protein